MASVTGTHREKLKPRRTPRQHRSERRARQIIDVTAGLLDRLGLDELTTIRIAREMGISVGTLYHYFPNKYAILYAMGENWLREWNRALDIIDALPVEALPTDRIVHKITAAIENVYREQRGVLPLVQAINSIPELRELDERHDELVIGRLSGVFKRFGIKGSRNELTRLARNYLELTHALMMVAMDAPGAPARRRTLADLKALGQCLLERHL